jgi:plastocyanin
MRVFTARFVLGTLVLGTLCLMAESAEGGPFRNRGARAVRAVDPCACPDGYYGGGYGMGYGGGYGMGYGGGYAMGQPGAYGQPHGAYYGGQPYGGQPHGAYYGGQAYGVGGFQQPGTFIPPTGVPVPMPGTGGDTGAVKPSDAAPANAEKARITDGTFEPATLTIKPGTPVRWTNDGKDVHTVTAVKGEFDSGDVQPGREFTATFTKPGTFEYYCRHHKEMKGTIIVK